jgi:hypothetical protein
MLLFIQCAEAQKTVSMDLAYTRNILHRLNGLNISSFYHFNERLVGGIEVNRYFPVKRHKDDGLIEISAWDFDLNFHYLIPLAKSVKLYPLTGISHTSEKEQNLINSETVYEHFWSFNTGAGVLYSIGKWSPHAEYMFTWGHINQQFLLVGLSYELEWGKKEKK